MAWLYLSDNMMDLSVASAGGDERPSYLRRCSAIASGISFF